MDADPALKDRIAATATRLGANLVKVADLRLLAGIETNPPDLLTPFTRAVSLAIALDHAIIGAVMDAPTPDYAGHYRLVNGQLEALVVGVAQELESAGHRAMALRPTSHSFDPVRCTDQLSHKAVAVAAGIGWQGKSLLTVSPQYGPRIRLATVLTDAPLDADGPIRNRCGGCRACADACPAKAIRNVSTTWHYSSRDEALDFPRCRSKVMDEFAKLPGIGASICGVCVSSCPWGKRSQRRAQA